jgi:hypothetical protein
MWDNFESFMQSESKINSQKTSAWLSPGFFAGVVLAVGATGAGMMVYCFNPGTHGFYPICEFHALTGLNCPGCGATRALYALLHGNLRLAFKDNALFLGVLAAMAAWGAQFAARKLRCQPATLTMSPKVLWVLLISALIFAVLRNLPGFEWLSP